MWLAALLVLGFLLAKTIRTPDPDGLRFKEGQDAELWRIGAGPPAARAWIAVFNTISMKRAGRGAVVTAWRTPTGAHAELAAVDFRRLSAANEYDADPYTAHEAHQMEQDALKAGLPIHIIDEGNPGEHWHIGELAL